jgi:uncharacterized cofD-like protein
MEKPWGWRVISILPKRPMRVATVGGGHGQSTLLKALAGLDFSISAVVAVSDDGGCSGKLRDEVHMPPPGDLRRCLLAMAHNKPLAAELEARCESGPNAGRSVGNQMLAHLWAETGGLQQASDLLGRRLKCSGRAIPASLKPCTISAVNTSGIRVTGETNIEQSGIVPYLLKTVEPPEANPTALSALQTADMIILGPGSLYTSVLAPLTIPEMAEAYANSRAKKVLMVNLTAEGNQTAGMTVRDYVETLKRHLGRNDRPVLDAVVLDTGSVDTTCTSLIPSMRVLIGNLRDPRNPHLHSVAKTAREFARWFGPQEMYAPEPSIESDRAPAYPEILGRYLYR